MHRNSIQRLTQAQDQTRDAGAVTQELCYTTMTAVFQNRHTVDYLFPNFTHAYILGHFQCSYLLCFMDWAYKKKKVPFLVQSLLLFLPSAKNWSFTCSHYHYCQILAYHLNLTAWTNSWRHFTALSVWLGQVRAMVLFFFFPPSLHFSARWRWNPGYTTVVPHLAAYVILV